MRLLQVSLSFALLLAPASDMPRHHAKAAAKKQARYAPAPPVVNTVYGPIAANLNGDGQAVGAYADPAKQTIYLQPDPNPFARAHETAHLFDSQVLSEGDRHYFQRLMQAPAGPWNHGEATGRVDGLRSPNEWFADYYAAAATGMTPQNGYSVAQFAAIGPKRMVRFQKALQRLADRQHLQPYK